MSDTLLACPVKKYTEDVLSDSYQLNLSLRKLRRSMRHCAECDAVDGCLIMRDFNAKFEAAIDEVVEQWGLK
jgi:hypothetical protein